MKQLLITIAAVMLVGCGHKSIGGYVSASSFSKKGFAKSHKQAQELRGKILKVWGYVDGLNVFPADSLDNQTGKWRFFLKAKPSDHMWSLGLAFRKKRHFPVWLSNESAGNTFKPST